MGQVIHSQRDKSKASLDAMLGNALSPHKNARITNSPALNDLIQKRPVLRPSGSPSITCLQYSIPKHGDTFRISPCFTI